MEFRKHHYEQSDGIPVELFQTFKDDAVKVLNMPANLENSAVATGPEKVFIPTTKNVQTATQLYSFHMLAKLCSKFSKLGFSSTWIENFQIFKLDLEKAEEPEIKLPPLIGWWRKEGSFRKSSTSVSLTTLKPLTVWVTTNWKILKDMGISYQTTLTASCEICMQVKKQQLELDMEQQNVPNQ